MVRLLMGYGLGAWLVIVPVQVLDAGLPVDAAVDRPIAAVVAAPDAGFVLDREGRVTRVGRDGSQAHTAWLGRLATPFGTAVAGHVVFGGLRDGEAVVAILGSDGRRRRQVVLLRAPRLDGVVLAGRDGSTLWLAAGDRLFGLDVPTAAVVDELPWPGGEPCVLDGVVHNLVADDRLRLDHVLWRRGAWRRAGPSRSMTFGQNAYCTPTGYEIRPAAPSSGLAPITTSTRRRYQLQADGALLDVTEPARPRSVGVTVPGLGPGGAPPAVQVDDSAGDVLFWCAVGRCAVASRSPARPATLRPWPDAPPAYRQEVHHYNLCSASCGNGARPHTRDVVGWLVTQRRPAALSLNEACYDDVAALADRFPARSSYTALATATACPGAVKAYGNHVLAAEPGDPWSAPFSTQLDAPCRECRGVACLTMPRGVLCSAHLESHRADVAAAQAQEYLALVAPNPTAVLAADFNLRRDDVDAILGPAGYRSADVGPTIATRQIDMIYSGPTRAASGETYCDAQASDHCYVMSTMSTMSTSNAGGAAAAAT